LPLYRPHAISENKVVIFSPFQVSRHPRGSVDPRIRTAGFEDVSLKVDYYYYYYYYYY
jgi:hypothetical protein